MTKIQEITLEEVRMLVSKKRAVYVYPKKKEIYIDGGTCYTITGFTQWAKLSKEINRKLNS